MTAAELFEVVRDVPKEAWPPISIGNESCKWCGSCGYIGDDLAELLFVGSMVKWLQSQAFIVETWEEVDRFYDHQDNSTKVTLSGTGFKGWAMAAVFRGKSTVEALAAACKEVKP